MNEFRIKNGFFSEGSSNITGSLEVTAGITGSLQGMATSASFAATASFITASNIYGPYGSNSVVSSSYALSASYAVSSSFSTTASYATFAGTASFATNATDILIYVKNTTGAQINKGVVVRISGATGDNALISTASYETDGVSANTLGITRENIANDSFGYVLTEGTLLGISLDPALGYTAGQLLYLGANGTITGSAPIAPLHSVRLGQVLRAQQNNGSMYVRIDNGYELGELHDVRDTTTTSSRGDLLVKSGSVWINSRQLTGSYGLTGSLNATSFTGSLFGTASWSENAITASFVTASNVVGTVTSASYAVSASFLIGGVTIDTGSLVSTSSFNSFTSSIQGQVDSLTAATSSYMLTSATASMLAPYVLTSQTASMTVLSASFANTASFVTASNVVGTVVSASYAVTASYAMNGGGGGTPYIRRSDYTSSLDPNVNYLYLGDAVTGSLESSPVWDISRLSISSSGATLTQTTSSAAWTDRYTVTYL